MSADELRNLLNAVPFRPFTVYLPDYGAYRIPDPELALLTPNGHTLVLSEQPSDSPDILDVALITRVEVEAEPAAES
jgi:hypothetical protein